MKQYGLALLGLLEDCNITVSKAGHAGSGKRVASCALSYAQVETHLAGNVNDDRRTGVFLCATPDLFLFQWKAVMNDFVWRNDFEIGIDFIDEDHRDLFKVVQHIKSAIEEVNCDDCLSLLTLFIEKAKQHFSREEQLLFESNYPELEDHRVYHKRLLIKAAAAKQICEGKETAHDLMDSFHDMADFLIEDIMREDIKFKSFLEETEPAASREI